MDEVLLDDLVGYKFQKEEPVENTEAFVAGRTANNVLLYGEWYREVCKHKSNP